MLWNAPLSSYRVPRNPSAKPVRVSGRSGLPDCARVGQQSDIVGCASRGDVSVAPNMTIEFCRCPQEDKQHEGFVWTVFLY